MDIHSKLEGICTPYPIKFPNGKPIELREGGFPNRFISFSSTLCASNGDSR